MQILFSKYICEAINHSNVESDISFRIFLTFLLKFHYFYFTIIIFGVFFCVTKTFSHVNTASPIRSHWIESLSMTLFTSPFYSSNYNVIYINLRFPRIIFINCTELQCKLCLFFNFIFKWNGEKKMRKVCAFISITLERPEVCRL